MAWFFSARAPSRSARAASRSARATSLSALIIFNFWLKSWTKSFFDISGREHGGDWFVVFGWRHDVYLKRIKLPQWRVKMFSAWSCHRHAMKLTLLVSCGFWTCAVGTDWWWFELIASCKRIMVILLHSPIRSYWLPLNKSFCFLSYASKQTRRKQSCIQQSDWCCSIQTPVTLLNSVWIWLVCFGPIRLSIFLDKIRDRISQYESQPVNVFSSYQWHVISSLTPDVFGRKSDKEKVVKSWITSDCAGWSLKSPK